MASITICDLNPSEKAPKSYLTNLSEKELDIQGGIFPLIIAGLICGPTIVGLGIGYGIHALTN